jgi:hypothetical protein
LLDAPSSILKPLIFLDLRRTLACSPEANAPSFGRGGRIVPPTAGRKAALSLAGQE